MFLDDFCYDREFEMPAIASREKAERPTAATTRYSGRGLHFTVKSLPLLGAGGHNTVEAEILVIARRSLGTIDKSRR